MSRFILAAIVFTAMGFGQGVEDPKPAPIEELARRLAADPENTALVSQMASQGGPQAVAALPEAVAALKAAFASAKRTGARIEVGVRWSQLIAGFLIRSGVHDQVYFDELAKYVRAAIDANPPAQYVWDIEKAARTYHSPGTPENGWVESPGYLPWCKQRGLAGDDCKAAVTPFALDINQFGGSGDPRALTILHEVLGLSNPGLVNTAVLELAAFGDTSSLSAIAAVCSRFSPKDADSIGGGVSHFDSPAMLPVLQQCVTDRTFRDALIKAWEERRAAKR